MIGALKNTIFRNVLYIAMGLFAYVASIKLFYWLYLLQQK